MSVPAAPRHGVIWKPYEPGQEALYQALAAGLHEFGLETAKEVSNAAPEPTGRRKVPYKRTIKATTYLRQKVVAGEELRNIADSRREIVSIVYTASRLGHLLERGTKPHLIPVMLVAGRPVHTMWRHPGSRRFPHFVPGLLAARWRAGDSILRGARTRTIRVNTKVL